MVAEPRSGLDRSFAVFDDFPVNGQVPGEDYSTGIPTVYFLWGALRRGVWVWCATGLAGLLIGLGLFVRHPPPFQAATSVVVVPYPNQLPTDAILTDVALAQSRTVAEGAMSRLGLPQAPAAVAKFVGSYTVTPVTDRVLLFKVSAPSSSEAVARAGALAAKFLQFRAQQARDQGQHLLTALQAQVTQAKQEISSVSSKITQLSAQPVTPAQQARLASLRAQLSQLQSQLPALKQTVTGNQVTTRMDTTQ